MSPDDVHRLVRAIERKDLSTAAHTWRVVLYTRAMAEEAGLGRELVDSLTYGAALHDVGKLDIPSEILQKPGPLTIDEFEIIKIHPVAGDAHMLELGVDDELVLDLIKYHHERWDGRGYPYGRGGRSIPVGARYFAVIDAFDAMTSIRPYRTDVGPGAVERAMTELHAGVGSRYWPEAVDMFTTLYRTGRLDHILHHFNDSAPVDAFRPEAPRHLRD